MKIGNFYIRRASSVKKILRENYKKRNDKPEYYFMTCGLYHSRLFGFCIYRDAKLHDSLMKEFSKKSK